MAEGLRKVLVDVLPSVSNGNGDKNSGSGKVGHAYGMTVEAAKPDISAENQEALRTDDGPDRGGSADVNKRKAVQVQIHNEGGIIISGHVPTTNGEDSTGRGNIEDLKTGFAHNATISSDRKEIEDEIKNLQDAVDRNLGFSFSKKAEQCFFEISQCLEEMKVENNNNCKAVEALIAGVEDELKGLHDKHSGDEAFSLKYVLDLISEDLRRNPEFSVPLKKFLVFSENMQSVKLAHEEFVKKWLLDFDDDCSGERVFAGDELTDLIKLEKEWSCLREMSEIYLKTKEYVGKIQDLLDHKDSILKAVKWAANKAGSDSDFGLSGFIKKVSLLPGMDVDRESKDVGRKPADYYKLFCEDLSAFFKKIEDKPQSFIDRPVKPKTVFKQLSGKIPAIFKLVRAENEAVQKLLLKGLPTVYQGLRAEPGSFLKLLSADLPNAYAQFVSDQKAISQGESVDPTTCFKMFKTDFDKNVASSENKEKLERNVKKLKREVEKLKATLELVLLRLGLYSESYSLDLEKYYKEIESLGKKMEDECKIYQETMSELRVVAETLGESKTGKLKLFVQELKSQKNVLEPVCNVGDLSMFEGSINECLEPGQKKQYFTLVGQFLNFLDAYPSKHKALTSINHYFRENPLVENGDDLSVKAGDALENEMACLLSKREWLSTLNPLVGRFAELKQWKEQQVNYYLGNKEAIKDIVGWVNEKADDEVAVSLLGLLQTEQVDNLVKESNAIESELEKVSGKRLRNMEATTTPFISRAGVGVNSHGVAASNKVEAGFKYPGSLEKMRGEFIKTILAIVADIQELKGKLEKELGGDVEAQSILSVGESAPENVAQAKASLDKKIQDRKIKFQQKLSEIIISKMILDENESDKKASLSGVMKEKAEVELALVEEIQTEKEVQDILAKRISAVKIPDKKISDKKISDKKNMAEKLLAEEIRGKRKKLVNLSVTYWQTGAGKIGESKIIESLKNLRAFLTFMDTKLPTLCKSFTEHFTGSAPEQLLGSIYPSPEAIDQSSSKAGGVPGSQDKHERAATRAEMASSSGRSETSTTKDKMAKVVEGAVSANSGDTLKSLTRSLNDNSESAPQEVEKSTATVNRAVTKLSADETNPQEINNSVDSGSEPEQLVFSDRCDLMKSVDDVKVLFPGFLGGDEQLESKFNTVYADQQRRHQLVLNEYLQWAELKQLLEKEETGARLKKAINEASGGWRKFGVAFKFLREINVDALDKTIIRFTDGIAHNTKDVKPEIFYDSDRSSHVISPQKADEITSRKLSLEINGAD